MKIGVPSGIGDISWLVSKVINSPEWPEMEFVVADGWPFRAEDYLKMLGKTCTYGPFSYVDILSWKTLHPYKTWADVVGRGFGVEYLEPNLHLEQGRPLENYLPDLPTDYHYKLSIPTKLPRAAQLLCKERYVGISAASYRGASAWKTWESKEWTRLCRKLIRHGYKVALLGGGWDDLTRSLVTTLPRESVLDLVGQTTFSQACAAHKKIPFYVGFSSGLGIIRTVQSLPTLMLWPSHQVELSTSWADPKDVQTKRYVASQYVSPEEVYGLFLEQERIFG